MNWWDWRSFFNGLLCYAIGWFVGHRTAKRSAQIDGSGCAP